MDRVVPKETTRDASYERQERSPYRASSPPTRMTGLQATKVLTKLATCRFDGENREEARNFLENVRDCKDEAMKFPPISSSRPCPLFSKARLKRWFRENKRDLTDLDQISEGLRGSIHESAPETRRFGEISITVPRQRVRRLPITQTVFCNWSDISSNARGTKNW
ncbi:unnamed protein product [Trichogramma brassicae]|uniref:Uncharacterized protein n=1 Tax=Trichogramma brassicae TaxID=86971 RepID=A0A6H5ING8_9HYME|nr:unnamed protein product [Trichogramma brassicae]